MELVVFFILSGKLFSCNITNGFHFYVLTLRITFLRDVNINFLCVQDLAFLRMIDSKHSVLSSYYNTYVIANQFNLKWFSFLYTRYMCC